MAEVRNMIVLGNEGIETIWRTIDGRGIWYSRELGGEGIKGCGWVESLLNLLIISFCWLMSPIGKGGMVKVFMIWVASLVLRIYSIAHGVS